MFPANITFEEVKNVTEEFNKNFGTNAFIMVEKDGYIVFNYAFQTAEIFPTINTNNEIQKRKNAILRECRGLTFDNNGNILARKYEKFFNMNQIQETLHENIDFNRPHLILEKLDGSMFVPMLLDNKIVWTSKMGITDMSLQVEEFVSNNQNYNDFALDIIQKGYTPIFEWCSRKNKIVIDYAEDKLILTSIRNNYSGNYMFRHYQEDFAKKYNIPIVKVFSNKNINQLVNEEIENFEGYVIWFTDNDQKIKVKLDWYLARHNAVDDLSSEKKVINMILNDVLDDVLPLLDKNDQDALVQFSNNFSKNVTNYIDKLKNDVINFYDNFIRENYSLSQFGDNILRREYALKVTKEIDKVNQKDYFGYFENKEYDFNKSVYSFIGKNLKTQKDIDRIRVIFQTKWSRNIIGE